MGQNFSRKLVSVLLTGWPVTFSTASAFMKHFLAPKLYAAPVQLRVPACAEGDALEFWMQRRQQSSGELLGSCAISVHHVPVWFGLFIGQ